MERRVLKPYHGLIFFVIIVVALMFPGAYMQTYWGTFGLAASEIMFLLLSLLYVLLLRGDFKTVFPLKKPKIISIMGTVLLWIGTILMVMVRTMILMCLFPQQMLETSQNLNDAFSQMPVFTQIIVTALLPAICEEAAHRGVIQNSFMTISNKWVVIIGVGILFGANHLSIWRFVPTAVLGIALAYVLYETGNIFYSMLFHFLNNAFSVASTASSTVSIEDTFAQIDGLSNYTDLGVQLLSQRSVWVIALGAVLMLACAAPFLICLSTYLVRLGKENAQEVTLFPKKHRGLAIGLLIAISAILLVGGLVMIILGTAFTAKSLL